MVICFFSTQYLPTPGGVERYTWNLARRCVAAGHRALVVTASLPGLPARERDADGIEIYRLPSWPVMGGRFPVLKPFADADDLWAQGIDFAVIQTRMYTQSVWAARQCKRRGIPALVIDHSTGYMLHGGLAGALGKAYEHAACGSIRRCGFPFYGVSGDVCRWLETFGIQAAGQGFFFNAHSLRVKHTINQVRLKDGTKGDIGIFTGQILTVKGKAILDATDVHRQHAVNSGAALVHAKVGTVQPRQFAGKLRHIRAARIAAFQHQRQHSGIRCAAAQCRVAQMDGNAAAVKFFGIQCGDKYTGSQFFTFQISILRISSEFLG